MSRILQGNSSDVVLKLNDDEVIKICGDDFERFNIQKNFLLNTSNEKFIKVKDINRNCYTMKYYPLSFTDYIFNDESFMDMFLKLLKETKLMHEKNCGKVEYDSYIIKLEGRVGTKFTKNYAPKNFANYWGFVHGDLTFSNILIDEYNDFVFIDPRGTEEANYYDYGKIMQSLYMYYEIRINNKYNTSYMKSKYDRMASYMFGNYDEELLLFYLGVHLLGAVPFLTSKRRTYASDFLDSGLQIFNKLGIKQL